MADKRKERLAATNFWDELFAMRDLQREQKKDALTSRLPGGPASGM